MEYYHKDRRWNNSPCPETTEIPILVKYRTLVRANQARDALKMAQNERENADERMKYSNYWTTKL